MWTRFSQCDCSLPGPTRSPKLRTRTLSPGSNTELRTKWSYLFWLLCLLPWTSCLLVCMPLSLLFATFLRTASRSRGWFDLQFRTLSPQANKGGDRRGGKMVSSQLIHALCSYKHELGGSSYLPNMISGSPAGCGAFPKVYSWIAQLHHSLAVIGGGTGVFHTTQLLLLLMKGIFKSPPPPLIMMNP